MLRPSARARRAVLSGLVAIVLVTTAAGAGAKRSKTSRVVVRAGNVELVKVGNGPDAFPADAQNAILATIRTYVKGASVVALKKGAADETALAAAFDAASVADVAGADRPMVTDEGLPKVRGVVKVDVAPVALTGLFDGDNQLAVVAAQLHQKAKWRSARGKAKLLRTGELVLTGQGDGTWRISEYTLTVTRSGRGIGPAAGTSGTPGTTTATTKATT